MPITRPSCGQPVDTDADATTHRCTHCTASLSGGATTALTIVPRAAPGEAARAFKLEIPPEFLARYRIERALGSGAMGMVYSAVQISMNRPVAVKFLMGQDEALVRRFLDEARFLAMLAHPHVVRVVDVGTIGPHTYLVTQLLTGGSLGDRLSKQQRLEPVEAVRIAREMLDGLQACHDKHIVHRDLKPANVMFDDHDRAILVDLGVARLLDRAQSMTRTGSATGPGLHFGLAPGRGHNRRYVAVPDAHGPARDGAGRSACGVHPASTRCRWCATFRRRPVPRPVSP